MAIESRSVTVTPVEPSSQQGTLYIETNTMQGRMPWEYDHEAAAWIEWTPPEPTTPNPALQSTPIEK